MARLTADIGDFLARLTRLEPNSLVRLRGREMWSRVPWNVLVTRPAPDAVEGDFTVSAQAWLELGSDDPSSLPRLDSQWRAGLPTGPFVVRESLPAHIVYRVSVAAAETLRATEATGLRGRAVGARALRDALLDHVPIIVAADVDNPTDVRVPQRIVQAAVRMGLVVEDDAADRVADGGETVQVVTTGPWIGISAGQSGAWWRGQSGLTLSPHRA